MIPEGWQSTEIGKLVDFKSGGTPSKTKPEFWGGNKPWISGKDLKQHYISSSIDMLSEEGFALVSKAPKGASLILVRGMTLLKDFPVGFVEKTVSFNQDIKALIPKKGIDGLFLSFLLVGKKEEIRQLVSTAGHGTGRLDTESISSFPVDIPPLPEQKKIAQILSTWDKAITTTEQLLANSQQQKKALMQQLLTGKKRLKGFEGEWMKYLLEELENMKWLELGRGNVISKNDMENIPGKYPVYSSSIKNNGYMGAYGKFMFDEEMISWSVDGGGNFFYRHRHKFSVTNVSGYMKLDTLKLNYQFISYQLTLLHEQYKFDYQSKAHPSVIRKLYLLAIPALEEQQAIAAVLSAADREIEVLQQKLGGLKQEKKALMQQLLTGKRRVKVENVA